MQLVDADRLCWAAEHGYVVSLASLQPLHCSPKNNLICGFPQFRGGSSQGNGEGNGEPSLGLALGDCRALAASILESAVAEAAEVAASLAATGQAPQKPMEGEAGSRGAKSESQRRGKNGGKKLGRPVLRAAIISTT